MKTFKEYYKYNRYYGKRFYHIEDPDTVYTIVKFSFTVYFFNNEGMSEETNILVEWYDNMTNRVPYTWDDLFRNLESGVWVLLKKGI